MIIEQKSTNKEVEPTRCSWCGSTDTEDKIYSTPGDDMENPKAYHRDCFEALQMFIYFAIQNPKDSLKSLMKQANVFVGLKRSKKS